MFGLSLSTVVRWWSRYKKEGHIREKKRAVYQEIIQSMPQEGIVYIDESGIEEGSCKEYGWAKIGEIIRGSPAGNIIIV